MIRVGIVGLGNMGMRHARLLAANPGVSVTGVTDLDPRRVKEAAALLGCAGYAEVDALLASGIEMLFVTVPNTRHAALACAALDRGIDVFVEKPLATNLADAQRVREAQRRSGRRLFVGYNRRFAPVYREAKRIVGAASFRAAHANIIQNDGDMRDPPWLTDVALTGGFMYDTTVHFFDIARFLMGEVTEIRALGKAFFYPIPDDFVIQLKFESGAFGVITTCGHASWISPFERVQVVGDHQSVITEELDQLRFSPGLGAVVEGRDFSKLGADEKWGYAAMHRHIFEVLRDGAPCLNGIVEGCRGVELIEACHRSARCGGEIIPLESKEQVP